MDLLTDLEATCSALGTWDGVNYVKGDDCLECIKDLIRFLRRDSQKHEVRRQLGEIQTVQYDLIPLVKQHHQESAELFDMLLRLLVNLTNPELLLFREEVPEDLTTMNYFLQLQSHRQRYQLAFVDGDLWKILSSRLGQLLRKDESERDEEEQLIVERILILVRNILQVPRDNRSEKRTDDDVSVHDQILWVLHKSGMEDLLLYLASAESEVKYCLHVLEIISLMFREQDPCHLATANFQRSKEERKADEMALMQIKQREEELKKARDIQRSKRHSRFAATYVVQNMKAINDSKNLIYNKPLQSLNSLDLDKDKRPKKLPKNRVTPAEDTHKRASTLSVRLFLKEFCIEFLGNAYNVLMSTVRDSLVRHRAQQNDESYYLWAMRFFMEFNRRYSFNAALVSETLNKTVFHYVQQQIEFYKDNFEAEKRNRRQLLLWSRRMHLGLRSYSELLNSMVAMKNSTNPEIKRSADILMTSVFFEPEYRELCLQLFGLYSKDKMTMGFLKDLVTTTHVFLKLMEHMSQTRKLTVAKRVRKRKGAKKSKKTGEIVSAEVHKRETNEEMWDKVSAMISDLLQDDDTVLPQVSPFDATLDVSIEDQKVMALYKIQINLKKGRGDVALALLRSSREVWPEGEVFGAADAEPEDEFMSLREILFAEMKKPEGMPDEENEPVQQRDEEPEQVEENPEELSEELEEEEEMEPQFELHTKEEGFDFKGFVLRFAVPKVCEPFVYLFKFFQTNGDSINHAIVKMFHRIAFDCNLPGVLFHVSLFRIFREIRQERKIFPNDKCISEMYNFGKFLLGKFFETVHENKKVFMEICFWKTPAEALEIANGYKNMNSSKKQPKSFWSEEDEEKLIRVFHQLKEMELRNEDDGINRENPEKANMLQSLELFFQDSGKTDRQIVKKLKDLGLIKDRRELLGIKKGRRNRGEGGSRKSRKSEGRQRRRKKRRGVGSDEDRPLPTDSSSEDEISEHKEGEPQKFLSRSFVETTDDSSDDERNDKNDQSKEKQKENTKFKSKSFLDSDDSSSDNNSNVGNKEVSADDSRPTSPIFHKKVSSTPLAKKSQADTDSEDESQIVRAKRGLVESGDSENDISKNNESNFSRVETPMSSKNDSTMLSRSRKSSYSSSDSDSTMVSKNPSRNRTLSASSDSDFDGIVKSNTSKSKKSFLNSDSDSEEDIEESQKKRSPSPRAKESPMAKKPRIESSDEDADNDAVVVEKHKKKKIISKFLESDSD